MAGLWWFACLLVLCGGVLGVTSSDVVCVECEYVMAGIMSDLGNSTDEAAIIKEIQQKVCVLLPSFAERESCKVLVSKLAKEMKEGDIIWTENYTPRASCGLLTLCSFECCETPYTPEQIHLSVTDDPTEMVVMWTTGLSAPSPVVQYGLSTDFSSSLSASAVQSSYKVGGWVGVLYTAVMTGLEPNTTYFYRVGDPVKGWQKTAYVYSFTSQPQPGPDTAADHFTFAVYADIGTSDISDATVFYLESFVRQRQLHGVIVSGDLSYANGYQPVWDDFFRKIEPVAAAVPYMAAVGNHESFFEFEVYKHRFTNPWRQSNSTSPLYFSFNLGNVHFVAVSTEQDHGLAPDLHPGGDQYEWLQQDLERATQPDSLANQPWIVGYAHRPLYCSVDKGDRCTRQTERLREDIEGLLNKYQVPLMMAGHNHCYQRTWPTYNSTPTQTNYNNPQATVYVVNGCAGNMEGLYDSFWPEQPSWSAGPLIAQYGFGILETFGASKLRYTFLSDGNPQAVLDQWEIVRDV